MRVARPIALVLALGLLIAAAVTAGGHPSTIGDHRNLRATGADAFLAQPDALPASAARLERDHRIESVTSPRSAKHPLLLLAVLAALFAVSGLSVRRAARAQRVSRPLTSLWFRSGGRAPPSFRLSVV